MYNIIQYYIIQYNIILLCNNYKNKKIKFSKNSGHKIAVSYTFILNNIKITTFHKFIIFIKVKLLEIYLKFVFFVKLFFYR